MATIKEVKEVFGFNTIKITQKGDEDFEVRMYFEEKNNIKFEIEAENHEQVLNELMHRGQI